MISFVSRSFTAARSSRSSSSRRARTSARCSGTTLAMAWPERLLLELAGDPGALGPREQVVAPSARPRPAAGSRDTARSAGGARARPRRSRRRASAARRAALAGRQQAARPGWRARGRRARAGVVPESRSSTSTAPRLQQVAVALERQVEDGVEQRMAGADEGGERLALRRDQRSFSKAMRS